MSTTCRTHLNTPKRRTQQVTDVGGGNARNGNATEDLILLLFSKLSLLLQFSHNVSDVVVDWIVDKIKINFAKKCIVKPSWGVAIFKLQSCTIRPNKTLFLRTIRHLRRGLVVRIAGSHPAGPGSIPGAGSYILLFLYSYWSYQDFIYLRCNYIYARA